MSTLLGQLVVKIGADASELDKGVSSAQNKMKAFGGSVSKLGGGLTKFVTGPIALVGGGLIALATKAGNAADELLDLSDQTGLSTDSLQEWRAVATVAGVDTDTVANAAKHLNKNMMDLMDGTGKQAEAMDVLGVSTRDANGDFRDMDDIMDDAMAALASIEDPALRNALAYELFGNKANDLIPILAMGADEMDNVRDSSNVIDEEALVKANEMRIAMDQLKEKFGHLAMEIGTKVIPILMDNLFPVIENTIVPAIEKFSEFVGGLFEWFGKLSPETQAFIFKAIGLAAALGPVLMVIGKIIGVVSALTPLFVALKVVFMVLLGPVGLVIAIIAALIAIGILLWKNWDTIREWGEKIWTSIKDFVVNIFEKIKDFFKKWMEWYYNLWKDVLTKVFNTGKDIWNKIRDFFTNTWNTLKDTATTIWNGLRDTVISAIETLRDKLKTIWESVRDTARSIWDGVSGVIKNAINGIIGMVNRFIDAFNRISIRVPSVDLPLVGTVGGFTIGVPQIPRIPTLHGGGIFNAPFGRRQGLALLEDGEHITPRGGRGSSVTINMRGMFEGAKLNFRDREDMKLLAQEIYKILKSRDRSLGVVL